jgi:type IV pilus assembly protein PilM
LPLEDAQDAARIEAAKVLPIPRDQAAIDVQMFPDRDAGGEDKWSRALLVAAPRELVDRHAECMERSGLEPAGLDAIQLALLRALGSAPASRLWRSHPWAVLSVGASCSELFIVDDGMPRLCRALPWGADHLTEAARVNSDSVGLANDNWHVSGDGQTASDSRTQAEGAGLAARPNPLLGEIRRSLIYYQTQHPEGSYRGVVGRIVLVGDGALIPGLADYLQLELGTVCEVGDPFVHADSEVNESAIALLSEKRAAFAACLGLILGRGDARGCDQSSRPIH